MNGTALKVQRVTNHVKGQELAGVLREMFPASKWSPSKVSRIEGRDHVDADLVAEYVAGLATFTTKTTSAVA